MRSQLLAGVTSEDPIAFFRLGEMLTAFESYSALDHSSVPFS
jgi:hypothetical protein